MLPRNEADDDSPIHVLEIAGNAIVGGMEKYVYNLAEHLPEYNIKVTCVTPYESAYTSSLRRLGSEVYITPMDLDPPWRSIQFVTQLIEHQAVDLVHAHLPRAHVLAGISAALKGIPAVATVHGMEITTQDLGISRTTKTHLTVVCQEAYAQALALGIPPERLTLIPNGVDLKTFNPNRNGLAFRRRLGISPETPLVGFVGRIAWEKGPDQFLQVAQHVHEQIPGVEFVIVGEGPMEDEIKAEAQRMGMDRYMHFAGMVANTQEAYPAFDVVVQTSRVEGMPFALLEAMACGRPVAAMGVGGVAEIIEANRCGILSAPGDYMGLANGVGKLLSEPQVTRQMGHYARQRAEELFDLSVSIQRMARFFRHLTKPKAGDNREVMDATLLPPAWTRIDPQIEKLGMPRGGEERKKKGA